ncbi:MAG TPA: basic amino acid ABC transporter substrate-binding protein [Egibacteraceae bacterium]|nr:basic amino acid ABC transporter substrate-binding protein [Egibacteraceae bacterium]
MTTRFRALVALLVLLAAACGDGGTEPGAPAGDPTENPDDLGLAEPGVLLVGSDLNFPPFEFVEGGEERGFDIELMNEIGARLGVEVTYVDANFDTIFQQLAGGDFDAIISAITITEERARTVAFTDPYFEATQALVVPEDSAIASTEDLAGQEVGAQAGTTGLDYARENFTESTITEFPDYPAAFASLETGGIDAVLADLPAAVEAVADSDALEIIEEIDTDEQYGIGVQQDNDALLDAINEALAEIIADGTYERIFTEWFPEAEVPERFRADGAAES